MGKVRPTQNQLDFLDWEFGAFFHFGLRAFYKGWVDWDKRDMDASVFNPDNLDCESWIQAFKDAGAKYAILTTKHHDGFANWPSAYTEYGVKNTSWRDGKGDVVREFVDACRKLDMKVGLYYSPAQRDGKTFASSRDYDDYFIAQISELLTNYGKIDYLWFDSCGSEGYEYDAVRIIDTIRALQPDIMIFGMWDPDVRWIGNEEGWAPLPNKYTYPNTAEYDIRKYGDDRAPMRFLPGECDTNLRSTWFDCEDNEDTIYELDELVGLYEMSVGRGQNLLLNIGPDCHGQLPEPDKKRLAEFGERIRALYGTPLEGFSPVFSFRKNFHGIFSREKHLVNAVILTEDITEGDAVRKYSVWAGKEHLLYTGFGIGHKAICKFPTVKADKIIVKIEESDGDAKILEIRPFYHK